MDSGRTKAANAVERMRRECGANDADFARERIEEARAELIEAMKYLDNSALRDQHIRLGEGIGDLDDLCAVLRERGGRS